MHTFPSVGKVPGVQVGVLLAWPCPACREWRKPCLLDDGLYECVSCETIVSTAELNACYRAVRALTLDEFGRN